MNSKQAMVIGMEIAERHAKHVKEFSEFPDMDIGKALGGNVVWLASMIMLAVENQASPFPNGHQGGEA